METAKRAGEECERNAFGRSANKQQYVELLKNRLNSIKNIKQRQLAQLQAQRQAQAAQQAQVPQQGGVQRPQSQQQQQPVPGQPQMSQPQQQNISQGQQQQPQNPAQTPQAMLQRMMSSVPIPQPLLNKLPQLFPRECNTWATIMPFFKNKQNQLPPQDFATVRQVFETHRQLITTENAQKIRQQRQLQQQKQRAAQQQAQAAAAQQAQQQQRQF
ncbi:unnamed protein product [Ambrosiozyma monospora]|uniref:Unnamed protein product n=1 Tax=Ambrosiozyma monospora TaxID=43982 RepID=A0ACB5U209_AMBMO|nr:unnamed protein product [Ambrosiozyma monospora]